MIVLMKLYWSAAWGALLPLIKLFLTTEGLLILKAAQKAAGEVVLNMPGTTGTQKREAAIRIVTAELIKQKLPVSVSMIYAAVKAAVLSQK